ncbi:MAG: hypothetical protein R3E89_02670 [Thiolinea sp.]
MLLWCILIERLSPALSAFWASVAMIFVVFTQHMFKGLFRGQLHLISDLRRGISDFWHGMISGAQHDADRGRHRGRRHYHRHGLADRCPSGGR